MSDIIEFEAVNPPPIRPESTPKIVTPDGRVFEELNAETGTFRVSDMAGRLVGYTRAERVEYLPTLAEQYLASR